MADCSLPPRDVAEVVENIGFFCESLVFPISSKLDNQFIKFSKKFRILNIFYLAEQF